MLQPMMSVKAHGARWCLGYLSDDGNVVSALCRNVGGQIRCMIGDMYSGLGGIQYELLAAKLGAWLGLFVKIRMLHDLFCTLAFSAVESDTTNSPLNAVVYLVLCWRSSFVLLLLPVHVQKLSWCTTKSVGNVCFSTLCKY